MTTKTRRTLMYVLTTLALVLVAISASRTAEAQTTIIHQHAPVQRVIVEHHYPAGVTYIPGQGGSRTIIHGGHYGPSTCYTECYHHGPRRHTTVIVPGHHRPRSVVQFGFSAFDHRGSGVSFGITDVR